MTTTTEASLKRNIMNKSTTDTYLKIPQVMVLFWVMKIVATTLGETGADFVSMTMDVGYLKTSMIFISFFLVTLILQLRTKKYNPAIFWSVIVSTALVGTAMSDFMDRTLELGYAKGAATLIAILLVIFAAWFLSERNLSVTNIRSLKGEVFYWTAILFSNTLGTALGDYIADDSGLGFAGSVGLISAVLAVVIALYYKTKVSRVLLFWVAFVLTRPWGAEMGDLMTKTKEQGGMDLGTSGSSLVLAVMLVLLVVYSYRNLTHQLVDA